MIQGLWDFLFNAIIDFRLCDADADTYKYDSMTALLARWEKSKKDKHGNHCQNQRKMFLTFVNSVEGVLVMESLVVLSQLSQVMVEKREDPLLQIQEWVKGCIKIAVARSYSRMIRGARLPSPLREREPDWDL